MRRDRDSHKAESRAGAAAIGIGGRAGATGRRRRAPGPRRRRASESKVHDESHIPCLRGPGLSTTSELNWQAPCRLRRTLRVGNRRPCCQCRPGNLPPARRRRRPGPTGSQRRRRRIGGAESRPLVGCALGCGVSDGPGRRQLGPAPTAPSRQSAPRPQGSTRQGSIRRRRRRAAARATSRTMCRRSPRAQPPAAGKWPCPARQGRPTLSPGGPLHPSAHILSSSDKPRRPHDR